MDSTTKRVIEEVAAEMQLEPGFLLRIIQLEETKAHLARRHGLFDELRELARKAAQRAMNSGERVQK